MDKIGSVINGVAMLIVQIGVLVVLIKSSAFIAALSARLNGKSEKP